MSLDTTPVALFVCNRPNHAQRLLKSLSTCVRLEECHLVIPSDGPKSVEHREMVAASGGQVAPAGAAVASNPRRLADPESSGAALALCSTSWVGEVPLQ